MKTQPRRSGRISARKMEKEMKKRRVQKTSKVNKRVITMRMNQEGVTKMKMMTMMMTMTMTTTTTTLRMKELNLSNMMTVKMVRKKTKRRKSTLRKSLSISFLCSCSSGMEKLTSLLINKRSKHSAKETKRNLSFCLTLRRWCSSSSQLIWMKLPNRTFCKLSLVQRENSLVI